MLTVATALYILGVVLPPMAVIVGLVMLVMPGSAARVHHTSEHAPAH